ncbi:MAG: 4-(cytidine 5'-diphospho)-2-C-methyl-D-erythritol kinase [Bacteroidota bacterium]
MTPLLLHPNAKINLGLFIKGKRADGYHLLETLYFPVAALQDELRLIPREEAGCQLELDGSPLEGDPAENLVVQAYRKLQAVKPALPGVHIQLTKHIPSGAGLGGGSSDAAFTLTGLNELFSLGMSRDELAAIGAQLGADVPFFIYNRPLLAKGIGTDFEEITLDFPYRIEIVPSAIHSSTIAAYKALDYRDCDPNRDLKTILQQPIETWPEQLDNDLEKPIFALYPELAEGKKALYERGALYAAMSGSGSALFGVFEE